MTVDDGIVSDCFVFLLSKAYQKGHQLVQKKLKPYGITNVQYVVLEMLWEKEGLTAAELSNHLMIDKATMSGILERMADADLLIKRQDAKDRRLFRLYPSKSTDKIKSKLIDERKAANEELLKRFSDSERSTLKRMLIEIL